MNRTYHTIVAALALVPVAATAQPTSPRAQYKDAVLGMTLDEWKRLPFPGTINKNELTLPICTDNPRWKVLTDPLPADPIELAVGVVDCSYYTDTKSRYLTVTARSTVPIGATQFKMFKVDYAFHMGRLFRIRGYSRAGAEADIVQGLTARFGKPALVEGGTVQNKMGATFPKTSYVWDLGGDLIRLDAPGGARVDELAVIYLDKAASAVLKAETDKRDPAINKM